MAAAVRRTANAQASRQPQAGHTREPSATGQRRRRRRRWASSISRKVALSDSIRGGYAYPASQTPWQEIQRSMVDQLSEGMVLKPAVKFQKVAQTFGVPRDNH